MPVGARQIHSGIRKKIICSQILQKVSQYFSFVSIKYLNKFEFSQNISTSHSNQYIKKLQGKFQ